MPSEYQAAIEDFTDAIKLRPDYAQAYSERAAAEAFRGSEAIGAGFISNVSPHWARLSAEDELEAYDLGDHDAGQVLNVGWGYYTLWIVGGGVGRPPALALSFFRQAAQLDPTNPVDLLDLGLADIAMGHYQAGAQSFSAGVRHMLYDCPAGPRRPTAPDRSRLPAMGSSRTGSPAGWRRWVLWASPERQWAPALYGRP